MSSLQLRLLPRSRPFAERLGADFFKGLPKKPGVYMMLDRAERALYVGQSTNLKQRLGSYRYIQTEEASRKIVRLLHNVEEVRWEVCDSAEESLTRENELIAKLRPKFNTMNVYSGAYRYIQFAATGSGLELHLSGEVMEKGSTFGAFKTGCIIAFGALLRLIWALHARTVEMEGFPCSFLSERPRRNFVFEGISSSLTEQILNYLTGLSWEFCDLAERQISDRPAGFLKNLLSRDVELARQFFGSIEQNLELRKNFGIQTSYIPSEQLNELLIRNRFRQ